MKTAISIPDDVFNQAEYLAKKQGISRSEFYVNAIKEFMSRRGSMVTEQLDAVYRVNGDQPGLDPVVEGAALADLPQEEW